MDCGLKNRRAYFINPQNTWLCSNDICLHSVFVLLSFYWLEESRYYLNEFLSIFWKNLCLILLPIWTSVTYSSSCISWFATLNTISCVFAHSGLIWRRLSENSNYYFRWLKNSVIEIGIATKFYLVLHHLKWFLCFNIWTWTFFHQRVAYLLSPVVVPIHYIGWIRLLHPRWLALIYVFSSHLNRFSKNAIFG